MPLGVPKVPFQLSTEDDAMWLDLYNCLYRERLLFMCQALEEELSNQLIGVMLYIHSEEEALEEEREKKEKERLLKKEQEQNRLRSEFSLFFDLEYKPDPDPDPEPEHEIKEVLMYINSPGGPAINGIAIYDVMHYIQAPVNTICAGLATSSAALVLANGVYGNRIVLPHARIVLRQPEGSTQGQALEFESEFKEIRRLRQTVGILFSNCTGQPLNKISADLDRQLQLTALGSKFYGIVDKVSITMDKELTEEEEEEFYYSF
uniref:ATP-dependent Clp protease n=1 Tax=Prototheca lentecrescens TaxID=2836214 RepID=UPI003001F8F4